MVEAQFGYGIVDRVIEASDLPSKGVYTAIGTYDHAEIVALLTNLSTEVQIEANILLKEFGKYLFDTFLKNYPSFFQEVDNAFDFFHSIDRHIHVEVLKLYPDATLPRFESYEREDGAFEMIYRSERKMAALAEGLIERTIDHYGKALEVAVHQLDEEGSRVKFVITTVAHG